MSGHRAVPDHLDLEQSSSQCWANAARLDRVFSWIHPHRPIGHFPVNVGQAPDIGADAKRWLSAKPDHSQAVVAIVRSKKGAVSFWSFRSRKKRIAQVCFV